MRTDTIKTLFSAVIVTALATLSVTPAAAQWRRERPTVVQNADEKGRAPYMQFQGIACPGGADLICQITFPAVPPGKRLVLQQVNATIAFARGGVTRTAIFLPEVLFFAFPVRPTTNTALAIVNETTLAYFESGQTPIFQIVLNDAADRPLVTATLSGYFVDLAE